MNNTKELIISDFYAWCKWKKKKMTIFNFFSYLKRIENRILVVHRLKTGGICKILYHILRIGTHNYNLYIWCNNIGKGVRIMHGFSTVINAHSIGDNFLVSQSCTIGWGKGGEPIIGNNVKVYAGAIIVGGIHIGDNSVIGAGSVVTKDVPPNTLVVGSPNRYIEINNK